MQSEDEPAAATVAARWLRLPGTRPPIFDVHRLEKGSELSAVVELYSNGASPLESNVLIDFLLNVIGQISELLRPSRILGLQKKRSLIETDGLAVFCNHWTYNFIPTAGKFVPLKAITERILDILEQPL